MNDAVLLLNLGASENPSLQGVGPCLERIYSETVLVGPSRLTRS